jgi:hypothetical protein
LSSKLLNVGGNHSHASTSMHVHSVMRQQTCRRMPAHLFAPDVDREEYRVKFFVGCHCDALVPQHVLPSNRRMRFGLLWRRLNSSTKWTATVQVAGGKHIKSLADSCCRRRTHWFRLRANLVLSTCECILQNWYSSHEIRLANVIPEPRLLRWTDATGPKSNIRYAQRHTCTQIKRKRIARRRAVFVHDCKPLFMLKQPRCVIAARHCCHFAAGALVQATPLFRFIVHWGAKLLVGGAV